MAEKKDQLESFADVEVDASKDEGQVESQWQAIQSDEKQPRPARDVNDPLNWSLWRKYRCILISCIGYFMVTYFSMSFVPSFSQLQVQLHASYNQVTWTSAIACLGMAVGPIATASLAEIYGRRIILILSTALAVLASGCVSLHGISFGGYMAARFFQGLGSGPAANIGLSIINDVSFAHERGFRFGLWAMSANLGTVLAPLGTYISICIHILAFFSFLWLRFFLAVGGFITSTSQYWVAYELTILFAALFILQCLLLPETLYPRDFVRRQEEQVGEASNDDTYMEEKPKSTRWSQYLVRLLFYSYYHTGFLPNTKARVLFME